MVEVPASRRLTLRRARMYRLPGRRCRTVDLSLPQAHGLRHRCVGRSTGRPARCASPFHDGPRSGSAAHEQFGNPPSRGAQTGRIHRGTASSWWPTSTTTFSLTAVGGDGLIQRAIQGQNERFEVLAFASGSQPHPGQIARRGHPHEPIDPKFIHTPSNPWLLKSPRRLDSPDRGAPFRYDPVLVQTVRHGSRPPYPARA